MSRGLGKTQRAVLQVLRERKCDIQLEPLAEAVYPELKDIWGPDECQTVKAVSKWETINRAVRTLECRGLIVSWIVPGWACKPKAAGWRKFVSLCESVNSCYNT